jgi:two-component system response regulator CpxR
VQKARALGVNFFFMDRILIVDDDLELCELVGEYLIAEGFRVEARHTGEAGVQAALSGEYALVVLDVMMPDGNGFEALRRIRAAGQAASTVPVLMLTARGEEVDRIVGLEIGADDYLTKPFSPRELVARIRAVLRRTTSGESADEASGGARERLQTGDVEMDTAARRVLCDGAIVELTSVEFDLLRVLLLHAGEVVPRAEISAEVLGRRLLRAERSIDMHISNLRKKLGPRADGQERIVAVRGVGYIYALAPEED